MEKRKKFPKINMAIHRVLRGFFVVKQNRLFHIRIKTVLASLFRDLKCYINVYKKTGEGSRSVGLD